MASLALCGGLLFLAACGAPGEPTPPHAPVPAAISDLTAQQLGDGVVLTFSLPRRTVEREALEAPPVVKIYRSFVPDPSGSPAGVLAPPKSLIYTIPSSVVDTYLADDRFRFVDPLKPKEQAAFARGHVVYAVRTSASKRKDSEDSNIVAVRLVPAPAPIYEVAAQLTRTAVELSWKPPERTSSGAPLPPLGGYRVYRAEVVPGADAEAVTDPAKARLAGPLVLLGVVASPDYRDTAFEFGKTYAYSVRSVGQSETGSIESSDSRLAIVAPRNVFPPAAPQSLVAIVVPAAAGVPAHVELSWSISPDPDVTGYNVYRGESAAPGTRLNRDSLPTAVFRDMSAVAGRRYSYAVTAVDRAGNESPKSAVVSIESSEEGQTHP